jgi:thioredoxin 1
MPSIKDIQHVDWEEEVGDTEKPVVVEFWHHKCSHCKKMIPIYEKMPDKFEETKFYRMNVLDSRDNRKLALEEGVMGTPTFKIYFKGKEIGEIVGAKTEEELVNDIEGILESKEEAIERSTPI